MITQTALSAMRTFLRDNIAYARYKVGSAYYQAAIQEAKILGDGRISVAFIIDHTVAGNITVTEVQLFNHNGELWATTPTSINRTDAQEGIFYRFRFTITEED